MQLGAGIIEPVQTKLASSVILAPNMDGTMPVFFVDFPRLNTATMADTYSLHRREDCIESLADANFFLPLDVL